MVHTIFDFGLLGPPTVTSPSASPSPIPASTPTATKPSGVYISQNMLLLLICFALLGPPTVNSPSILPAPTVPSVTNPSGSTSPHCLSCIIVFIHVSNHYTGPPAPGTPTPIPAPTAQSSPTNGFNTNRFSYSLLKLSMMNFS